MSTGRRPLRAGLGLRVRVRLAGVVMLRAAAAVPAGGLLACSSFSEAPVAPDGDAAPDGAAGDAASPDATRADAAVPLDAGCAGDPACSRLVFVTTQAFDGALGGVAGADAKCQAAASTSRLLDVRTHLFIAWLSTEGTSPSARFAKSTKGYRRVDGPLVATDLDALLGGNLLAPINRDEHGQTVAGDVWTGTSPGGQAEDMHCANWAITGGKGVVGSADQTSPAWTNAKAIGCDATARLYCFER